MAFKSEMLDFVVITPTSCYLRKRDIASTPHLATPLRSTFCSRKSSTNAKQATVLLPSIPLAIMRRKMDPQPHNQPAPDTLSAQKDNGHYEGRTRDLGVSSNSCY
jgi:hypothetical protein